MGKPNEHGHGSGHKSNHFSADSDMEDIHFSRIDRSAIIADTNVDEKYQHPADLASWWSYSTFSWLNSLMFSTYRNGFDCSTIPKISHEESSELNTDLMEKLIIKQKNSGQKLSFGKIVWQYAKRRVLLTSFVHFISIFLGFLVPTLFMKKLLEFARSSDIIVWEGIFWVVAFVFCELSRIFFFTLTWAMSYRTGLRLKIGSMGVIFRKVLKIRQLDDQLSSMITTVITSDCNRIYDVIVSCQMALGGPCVLIFSIFYIIYELGFLPLIGLIVFPLSYPIQMILAKATGSLRRKALSIRDKRITFLSQALENIKFLKMFAWEKYYRGIIAEIRKQETSFLRKGQLFQSLGIVINPTFPHIGIIITFVIYVSTGNELTATQAFCILGLFFGRLRPSIAQLRAAIRSYYEASVALTRIECFTILFLFSLFGYSIRSVQQLITFYYTYQIYIQRMEYILRLPEKQPIIATIIADNVEEDELESNADVIVLEEVKIIRRAPQQSENIINPSYNIKNLKMTKDEKKELKVKRKEYQLMNTAKLLKTPLPEIITFELEPLNMKIRKSIFIGITGNVGSGKTTLLKAICGGIPIDHGNLYVNDGVAYVSQVAWIFKGSVRDNILFGTVFDPVLYYTCLYSCCLLEDVGILSQGDKTSAFNLSGGQKQRVCLARALYHSNLKNIYLLDDPFSSLDTKVGKLVFDRFINDQLIKLQKTIILVTHQLQFLQNCDEILVFNDGNICERGTHRELLQNKESHYASLAANVVFNDDNGEIDQKSDDSPMLDCSVTNSGVTSFSYAEKNYTRTQRSHTTRGSIATDVFALYIKHCGGYLIVLLVLLSFAVSIATTTFSSWWLKDWLTSSPTTTNSSLYETEAAHELLENATIYKQREASIGKEEVLSINNENFAFKRNIYAGIILLIIIACVIRSVAFTLVSIKAARGLHCLMLSYLFRSRIRAIEKYGTGQITNLLSKDMEDVDIGLPNTLEFFLQNVFIVLSILIVVTAVFPIFLIPLILLCIIFYFVRKVYQGTIRDLKRLEAEMKTPIFTKIQETSNGLDILRAYGKESQCLEEYNAVSDEYHSIYYIMISSMRWLSFRLDILAVSVTGITASLIIIFHGHITAASAGLALSYAAQLSGIFQYTVRLASETESKFISVERMKSFLHRTTLEEPELFVSQINLHKKPEKLLQVRSFDDIRQDWPSNGRVKFDSVCFCYNTKTLILNNISFEVEPSQKIGIIGRTGAGKSSIISAFFRLNELTAGQILIDDVDIADVSLSRLRAILCIIPQESSVIQNSIRFNLDPGKMHTDDELWKVLEKTGLKDSVESLDSEAKLSQGQKQLLSVARAILRHAKVVFVDEATSNCDSETSALLDQLLIEEFQSSTVFIIAHRPSAVRFCDKLLVLDQGRITNFGPADVIRKNENFFSYFDDQQEQGNRI